MVVKHIQRKLQEKSDKHSKELHKLGLIAAEVDLPPNVHVLPPTPQFLGMNTILQNPETEQEDFVFYFDRLASILIEKYWPLFRRATCSCFSNIAITDPWI
jgi:uridine kinase